MTRARRAALLLLLALIASAAGCRRRGPEPVPPSSPAPIEQAPDSAHPEFDEQSQGVVHVVRPGETLWRIAHTYGVDLAELAAANGISDPTRIEVGQPVFVAGAARVLEIPPSKPAGSDDQEAIVPLAGEWGWPVDGPVTSRFGEPRGKSRHQGIDISTDEGAPVRAARDGTVVFAGKRGNYGLLVIIDHGEGYATWYAHNRHNDVRTGDSVRGGALIARAGRTGNASGVHVHFEIRRKGRPLDPLLFLPSR